MEKWVVTTKRADFNGIGQRFSIDPVTARIIRNRDVIGDDAIEAYLHGDIKSLNDPHTMKDIIKAASILKEKIVQRKKIRVIGDYDIDGIQSTYILVKALRACNAVVDTAIPDRIIDGYGLNERLVKEAVEAGVDTVLTCDNGIAAGAVIALGMELGLTIIITDHHEVPYEEGTDGSRTYLLPPADAVVNPKQQDCSYPYKELCGGAVAYKLAEVLYELMGMPREAVWDYLQYAAFATVGDVMELTGENRIIVKEGLKRLQQTDNPGLRALMQKNGLEPSDIKSYHIGFVLGPCLNASGRLDTAQRALQLLLAEDENEANKLATDLVDLNMSRKEMTIKGTREAEILAQEAVNRGDKVLVLFLPDCHESLAGIIAGRIREKYNRPVFILTRSEEGIKGSGRSIERYSMFAEMCRCKELFTKFGGHPMAAGLSMTEEKITPFWQRLNENTLLQQEDFFPRIKIDVPMPVDYITKDLIDELSLLEPFGKGNEKPVFADKNLKVQSVSILGKNKNVCKLRLLSSRGLSLEAMYFGDIPRFCEFLEGKYGKQQTAALFAGESGQVELSLVYYPDINRYQGRENIQLIIKNYC